MESIGEKQLLRIFMGSLDKIEGSLLYEEIVYAAQKQGMAGVTVLKGTMGYGASSLQHTAKIFEIADEQPIVVEIIDEAGKIDCFIEHINPLLEKSKLGGLITTENITVRYYKGKKRN